MAGRKDVCRHAGGLSERRVNDAVPIATGGSGDDAVRTVHWLCMTCFKADAGAPEGSEKRMAQHGRQANHPVLYDVAGERLRCVLCALDVTPDSVPPRMRELASRCHALAKPLAERVALGQNAPKTEASTRRGVSGAAQEESPDRIDPLFARTHGAAEESEAPTGLRNLGNTCFMNATLQALASLEGMRAAEGDGDLGCALYDLLRSLRRRASGNRRVPVHPGAFFGALSSRFSFFDAYEQQDAHDFLRLVFNALDDEWDARRKAGGVPADRAVAEHASLFGGEVRQRTECLRCRAVTTRVEATMDMSLALCKSVDADALARQMEHVSLKDSTRALRLERLLAASCRPTRLEGDDAYACERCYALHAKGRLPAADWRGAAPESGERIDDARKTVSSPALCTWRPTRLPQCLVVHLQRFSVAQRAGKRRVRMGYAKDDTPVALPPRLDMSRICDAASDAPVSACVSSGDDSDDRNGDSDKDDAPGPGATSFKSRGSTYVLRAAVVHEGSSPQSGHYIALVNRPRDGDDDAWFYVSDTSVSSLPPGRRAQALPHAYLALYERV